MCFLRLGCISFGGPVAHLGYFHREFVEKRRWLSAEDYADLVALCQFLPGPASSQVVFGLGRRMGGLRGALLASLSFLAPSAVLMIALGCGLSLAPHLLAAPWVHGLQLAALAVVIQAVATMARQLCPDWPRRIVALTSLALMMVVSTSWMQVGVLLGAALVGRFWLARPVAAGGTSLDAETDVGSGSRWAAFAFVALLVLSLWPVVFGGGGGFGWAATFYRAGALVFGGGHVVLPWLREGMVDSGWMEETTFLAGYGAAQAVPGPLFSFAGYLGAVSGQGFSAIGLGISALMLLFLPAWLSVYAAEPWWHRLRRQKELRAAMAGANASVVGLLASVAVSHLALDAVRSIGDAVLAGLATVLLLVTRLPVWSVVVGCAGGAYLLRSAGGGH